MALHGLGLWSSPCLVAASGLLLRPVTRHLTTSRGPRDEAPAASRPPTVGSGQPLTHREPFLGRAVARAPGPVAGRGGGWSSGQQPTTSDGRAALLDAGVDEPLETVAAVLTEVHEPHSDAVDALAVEVRAADDLRGPFEGTRFPRE